MFVILVLLLIAIAVTALVFAVMLVPCLVGWLKDIASEGDTGGSIAIILTLIIIAAIVISILCI